MGVRSGQTSHPARLPKSSENSEVCEFGGTDIPPVSPRGNAWARRPCHVLQQAASAPSRLGIRVHLPREGEAPAEPLLPVRVSPSSRLSRSFAFPPSRAPPEFQALTGQESISRLRSRREVERTPRSVPPGPRGPGYEGAHRIVECSRSVRNSKLAVSQRDGITCQIERHRP